MYVADEWRGELVAYQLKMLLGNCLISDRRVEMRIHHIRVGNILKNLSWGVSFP